MALPAEDGRRTEAGRLLQQLHIDREQPEEHPDSRRRQWIVGAILFVLVLVAGVVASFALRSRSFEIETAAAITPVDGGGSTATLQATGYVTARRQATVSAQITGTITEVLIEEGEYVKAGQVLTRLENNAQKASLAQAQAQVKVSQALLNQYDAELAQARRDLKRSEDLVARQLVSEQAIEIARTQVATVLAQVESQHRQVELSQAAVQGAEVQLNYTTVRAPFSGVIVAKTAQAGEIVSPISAGGGFTRTGIGTIVDMDSLEIEIDVNEAYINRIKPGQPARAVLDAYPNWTIPARVIAIIPTADRSKATVKVRVSIDEKDPRILPDMGTRVSFHGQEPKRNAPATSTEHSERPPKGVFVPDSAVVERSGKSFVFTVSDDRANAQAIVPGQTHGGLRLVEGVPIGAIVVRAPPDNMNDGARVRVKAQ